MKKGQNYAKDEVLGRSDLYIVFIMSLWEHELKQTLISSLFQVIRL